MNDDEMARAVNAAVQADMARVARASSPALADAGPALRGAATAFASAVRPDMPAPRPVPPRVAPAYEYVADLTAAAAAALEPPLRAVVHWPDGQRQEWAVPAAERAAVEAALAAAGVDFTIERGDD